MTYQITEEQREKLLKDVRDARQALIDLFHFNRGAGMIQRLDGIADLLSQLPKAGSGDELDIPFPTLNEIMDELGDTAADSGPGASGVPSETDTPSASATVPIANKNT